MDGSLTKNQVYTFLNKLDISKPLDHQMQILFGEYQKDEIHVYSSDIYNPNRSVADEIEAIDDMRERFDKARSTYLAMGGYSFSFTTCSAKSFMKSSFRNDFMALKINFSNSSLLTLKSLFLQV